MNSSSQSQQMMDKQILSGDGGFFDDLMINNKEDIVPSYDFHPIRTSSSLDSSSSSILKNTGFLEPHEFIRKVSQEPSDFITKVSREPQDLRTKVHPEKEKITFDASTVAEIDRTVKKHVDTILHALEGVSSRLSQLESRTHHIESSVGEVKLAIGNYSGNTDGRIRQFENILREVQTGVQVLRDKQEIMEAQIQLAKSQAPKVDHHQPDNSSTNQSQASLPQQPIQQQYQTQVTPSQPSMLPALPAPNAPPPPALSQPSMLPAQLAPNAPPPLAQSQPSLLPVLPASNAPPPAQPPYQPSVPSLPRETYFQPPAQVQETTHQQYQAPIQQPLPQPQRTQQHFHSAPPQLPQYPQSNPSQQPVNPSPQLLPPIPQPPEESVPYGPSSQSYPPSIRQPAHPMQTQGPQFYGQSTNMYEPPPIKPSSGQPSFSSGYGQSMGPGFMDPYPYSGSPTRHSSNPGAKQMPFSSSVPSSGPSSNYPQLPRAQLLPQATPTSSNGSSGRVPVDDVVDKVSTMGFSREQVRATVRKLTENGQSVDLNVVLDKLMNDGEIQPQKGWFGR